MLDSEPGTLEADMDELYDWAWTADDLIVPADEVDADLIDDVLNGDADETDLY